MPWCCFRLLHRLPLYGIARWWFIASAITITLSMMVIILTKIILNNNTKSNTLVIALSHQMFSMICDRCKNCFVDETWLLTKLSVSAYPNMLYICCNVPRTYHRVQDQRCRSVWKGETLRWRHNGTMASQITIRTIFLLNCLFWRRSKKTSKLRVTGLCAGNSPMTGEFLAQMASNAENVPIRWRHHDSNVL